MEPAPRHRRWIWLGILLGIPVLICLVFKSIFAVNAVGPKQINAAAALIQTKLAHEQSPPIIAEILKRAPTNPMTYDEFLTRTATSELAAVYLRLNNNKIAKPNGRPDFPFYHSKGPGLTAEEKQWLVRHHAIIEDLLKLADLGRLPSFSCEQMLTLMPPECYHIPLVDFSISRDGSMVLLYESRRLREAGDFTGAAQALFAIERLADSMSKPRLDFGIYADSIRLSEYSEIADWLIDPPPRDILILIRRKLADAKPTDYRALMDVEFIHHRSMLVGILNGTFGQIMSVSRRDHERGVDIFSFADEVQEKPMATISTYLGMTTRAIQVKSTAKPILREFDEYYARLARSLTTGEEVEPFRPFPRMYTFLNGRFYFNRRNITQAQLNLDLDSLDELIDGAKPDKLMRNDPFTAQPLHRVEETTTTLFYSAGPDGTDQRGAVVYDPTNGTDSGDIVVRIRK